MYATGDLAVDVLGSVVGQVLPVVIGDVLTMTKDLRKRKRLESKTIEAANREVGRSVSEILYDDIHMIADNNDFVEIDLISTAIRTNKWINYAIYYMTDDTNLLKCGRKERELINAICELAGFGRVYDSVGSCDLRDYDSRNPDRKIGSKFILLLDELMGRLKEPEFQTKMNLRKAKLNKVLGLPLNPNYSGVHTVDKDGIIHPIFFSNTPLVNTLGPRKGEGIDQPLFDRLEVAFKDIISDKNYCYTKNPNGLVDLTIQRDNTFGATEKYLVDNGTLLGGTTISVLGEFDTVNGGRDSVFIDVRKHPDIAYKILSSIFYRLSVDEVMTANSDMLSNGFIYTYIDFSNTPWFDYLSFTDKVELGNNLIEIVRSMHDDHNLVYPPRLRFTQYTDPNNFVLVSDNNVLSPLSDTFVTTPNILEGLSYVMEDGKYTTFFGGKVIQPVLTVPLENQILNNTGIVL